MGMQRTVKAWSAPQPVQEKSPAGGRHADTQKVIYSSSSCLHTCRCCYTRHTTVPDVPPHSGAGDERASDETVGSWNCTGVVVFHLDFGGSSEESIVCVFFLWPLTSPRCPPPGCSDHANHGPHYVHAACQHDGPYHTADEPSVPGHYRKCEYNACNYLAHTRSDHNCKLRCLVSLTHFHYCRQSEYSPYLSRLLKCCFC